MKSRLDDSRLIWRLFFEDSPQPMWVYDRNQQAVGEANEAAADCYGMHRERLAGSDVGVIVPDGYARSILAEPTPPGRMIRGGVHLRGDGTPFEVDIGVRPIADEPDAGLLITVRDVSERSRTEHRLMAHATQMAEAQSVAHFGSFEWDIEHDRISWSDELYRIFGLRPGEFEATYEAFLERLHPEDRPRVDHLIRSACEHGGVHDFEERVVRPDGETRVLESRIEVLTDTDGNAQRLIGVCHDVTELDKARREVDFRSLHDPITTLPNKLLIEDRLKRAIAVAGRRNLDFALLFIDLDRFMRINESLGHGTGDRLLVEVGQRLRNAMRETDTVGRFSGDEFVVITDRIDGREAALEIAGKLTERLAEPFMIGEDSFHITASIGIAVYPHDGLDSASLVRNAHAAMYHAKELGGNSIQLFSAEMNRHYRERLELQEQLRAAVARNEFVVHFQPIVRSDTRRVETIESLVRWQHPKHGLMPPDKFIPIAEETGLITEIGMEVLRSATRQVRALQNQFGPISLSVNLSVRQLRQKDLLESIDQILEETGFSPDLLELEVTETIAIRNAERAMSQLREFQERGIRTVIDDFGSGQTSMIYLRQFPISAIKIDKLFIREMLTDEPSAAIVRAIISLAHELGLKVVAEGVEAEEQAAFLAESGCDLLQGYHLGKPMEAPALEEFLAARS